LGEQRGIECRIMYNTNVFYGLTQRKM